MNMCYHEKKEGGGMCIHTNAQSDTVISMSQFILKHYLLHSINTLFAEIGNDLSFTVFRKILHSSKVFMSLNVCMLVQTPAIEDKGKR
jgi:hypothetical protein